MTASEPGRPPLARLLAIGYRSLIDGLHEQLRQEGWLDVRPAFGFVLLAARDAPTTGTELARLMGSTKQAASKLIDTMVSAGYIQRTVADDDARQRSITLTARGRELLETVEVIYERLEDRWAERIGARSVERLRVDLVKVLATDTGALPPVRPTW